MDIPTRSEETTTSKSKAELETSTSRAMETSVAKSHSTVILATIAAVVLLMSYVLTMVLPAIYTIQKDLSTTATMAAWITSAFVLVGAASATLLGKLGDVYGKKRLFLISFLVFIMGIGLAGFSQSIYFLIFSMAVAGVGFAVFPLGLALLTDVFSKDKLATAQGIIAGASGISSIAGLVLGSYVVQNLGWRYAFYTTVPICIIFFGLSAKFLKSSATRVQTKVDYAGAFILLGGVALSLLYLTEGTRLGWLSLENVTFLILGLILTFGFFVFERDRSNPLIQLGLLRIRNVLAANLITLMSGLLNFLLFYALIYFAEYQKPYGLGLGILATGLALTPATLIMLVVGPTIGKAMTRVGPKPVLLVGSLILALGLAFLMGDRSSTLAIAIGASISLAGIVSLLVPLINMVSVSLPKESVSTGLGMNTMLKSLGQAIGPILATTIMTSYTVPVTRVVNGHPVVVAKLASSTAFNLVFAIGIAITIIAAIVSLFVKNYSFKKTEVRDVPQNTT